MSLCGHMTKADKEEWSKKNLLAQVDSAVSWKREQEAKSGEKIVRSTRANAGRNGLVDYTSPSKERPNSPPPAGRDLTRCSQAERNAHRQAMQDQHKARFSDAHWTHTIPLIEAAQTEDILRESVGHRLVGSNKKFVPQKDQPTKSRAPADVDNHLFTGAVQREAESEQQMIARKIENRDIELSNKQGIEDLKDEMDEMRKERASNFAGGAVPTSSSSEIAL